MNNELDLSKVIFSKWDKRFGIKIPKIMNEDLAYEIGFHIGDGHLSIKERSDGSNLFLIVYSGHWTEEKEFYTNTIIPIIKRLYNKETKIRKERDNELLLYFKSQAIATFKNKVLDLPVGKKSIINVPILIKNADEKIKRAFVSGLIDSDFSLTFKRIGVYPRFSTSLSLGSQNIIEFMKQVLHENRINSTVCVENRKDERYNPVRFYKQIRLDINGSKNLNRLMDKLVIKNPVHLTKYELWSKTGHCQKNTNLKERMNMLASVAQAEARSLGK